MAPKRKSKKAAKTVVTAMKVVEETVQAVVSPDGNQLEDMQFSTRKDETITISPSVPAKSIPVQHQSAADDDETQPVSEPETAPTPPGKEAPRKEMKKEMGGEKKKKRRRRREVGGMYGGEGRYKTHLYRVLRQVHPELGISGRAMTIINNLMGDMFEKLAEEAARLEKHAGKRTMSAREVQGAVKLVLPGELGKHAVAEGNKDVTNYMTSN